MREIGEIPDRANEPALARVVAVHGLAQVLRVGLRGSTIGIEAHANGAGADHEGLAATEGAHALRHGGKRFKALRHRAVIARMDEG